MDQEKHIENIKKQFSQQAEAYTAVKAHADALETLIELTNVSKKDRVIDIACGSGIVACEFARYAQHVIGIDITENMLNQARELQLKNKLTNVEWILDDVVPLKFESNQFSIVVTRFSFHHFLDCETVLEEMIRVCKPAGIVMVIDVALPKDKLENYDAMEKLRDSSHVGALSTEKFEALFQDKKLFNCKKSSYTMAIELDNQLNASFPDPGNKEKLRSMILNDIGRNNLGINVAQKEGKTFLYYPIEIYCAQKK